MNRLGWVLGLVILTAPVFLSAAALPRLAPLPVDLQPTETAAPASLPAEPVIHAPIAGQVLQGKVAIQFETAIPDFGSAELAFTYHGDTTGAWFLLYEANQPQAEATVVEWDTAAISDGTYDLRLAVSAADGSVRTAVVPGLRVRNYTPVETDTPFAQPAATTAPVTPAAAPTVPTAPVQTAPAGSSLPVTATPPPPASAATPASVPPAQVSNPVELEEAAVIASTLRGGLAAAGFFALAWVYAALKRLRKPR